MRSSRDTFRVLAELRAPQPARAIRMVCASLSAQTSQLISPRRTSLALMCVRTRSRCTGSVSVALMAICTTASRHLHTHIGMVVGGIVSVCLLAAFRRNRLATRRRRTTTTTYHRLHEQFPSPLHHRRLHLHQLRLLRLFHRVCQLLHHLRSPMRMQIQPRVLWNRR